MSVSTEDLLTEQSARERARAEVAQTLHDTLCQSLSGLQFLVRLTERKAAQLCPDLTGDLQELREMISASGEQVHVLVQSLRGEGSARRNKS